MIYAFYLFKKQIIRENEMKSEPKKKRFSFYYPRKTINFNWIKQKRLFFMFFRRVNLVNGDFCDEMLNGTRFLAWKTVGVAGSFIKNSWNFVQRIGKSIASCQGHEKSSLMIACLPLNAHSRVFFQKIPRNCMQTWRKYLMCIQITLIDLERSTSIIADSWQYSSNVIGFWIELNTVTELKNFLGCDFQINQKTFSIS